MNEITLLKIVAAKLREAGWHLVFSVRGRSKVAQITHNGIPLQEPVTDAQGNIVYEADAAGERKPKMKPVEIEFTKEMDLIRRKLSESETHKMPEIMMPRRLSETDPTRKPTPPSSQYASDEQVRQLRVKAMDNNWKPAEYTNLLRKLLNGGDPLGPIPLPVYEQATQLLGRQK